jgi:hypothetical protein
VHNIRGKQLEGGLVSARSSPQHDISRDVGGENPHSSELSQATLQLIARDCRLFVPGHDEPNARSCSSRTCARGSGCPDVEIHRPDALPLVRDVLQLCAPRNSCVTRKAELCLRRVMRLRTYPGGGRSAASVPSSADEPALRDPTSFPCAHETRASSAVACCADGMSASP